MCELYKTYFSNGCYKGLNFKKKVKHKNINVHHTINKNIMNDKIKQHG